MKLVAPLAGAAPFAAYGAWPVIAIDALTFLLAAAATSMIRIRRTAARAARVTELAPPQGTHVADRGCCSGAVRDSDGGSGTGPCDRVASGRAGIRVRERNRARAAIGRVSATAISIVFAGGPLGLAIGAALVAHLSFQAIYVLIAVITAATAMWARGDRTRRFTARRAPARSD